MYHLWFGCTVGLWYTYMYTFLTSPFLLLFSLIHLPGHYTGGLSCCCFNMDSGRVTNNSSFPQPSSLFLLQQVVPHAMRLNLFSLGLNVWMLEDGRGGIYPLGYDCAGNIKQLPFLVSLSLILNTSFVSSACRLYTVSASSLVSLQF